MPLPVQRDDHSAPFFDAAAAGRLLIRAARDGRLFGPAVVFDPEDPAETLQWTECSGRARLVSWTVSRNRPDEHGRSSVRAVGGLVALREGPWILAPLDAPDPAALRAGMELVVTFPPVTDGETRPVFAAASA